MRLFYNSLNARPSFLFRQLHNNSSKVAPFIRRNSSLTDSCVKNIINSIEDNLKLESLDLSGNSFGYEGIGTITDLIKPDIYLRRHPLQHLNISNNNIGNKGVNLVAAAIYGNPYLKTLDLRSCNIGDAGAETLAKVLINHKHPFRINLSLNPGIGEKGWNALKEAVAANKSLVIHTFDNVVDISAPQPICLQAEVQKLSDANQVRLDKKAALLRESLQKTGAASMAFTSLTVVAYTFMPLYSGLLGAIVLIAGSALLAYSLSENEKDQENLPNTRISNIM